MTTTFEFAGYTLRLATFADMLLARAWTDVDPDHAGRVAPEFWVEQKPLKQAYLLSDADGPVFFFKGVLHHLAGLKTLEIHIQFPPYEGNPMKRYTLRRRLTNGLVAGTMWLEERMRGVVDEYYFESASPELIGFCVLHLGFEERDGKLTKRLGLEVTAGR